MIIGCIITLATNVSLSGTQLYLFTCISAQSVEPTEEGEYYAVEFEVEKNKCHYVGKVLGKEGDDIRLNCLRRIERSNRFRVLDPEPEICAVAPLQIKYKLPAPRHVGQTRRQRCAALVFDVLIPEDLDLR